MAWNKTKTRVNTRAKPIKCYMVPWAAMKSLWWQIKHRQKREINLPTILREKKKEIKKEINTTGAVADCR